jgi:hypothetical protein
MNFLGSEASPHRSRPERLQRAASEVGALGTTAFDATDPALLKQFFRDLPTSIDHIMVTAGRPNYGRLIDLDFADAHRALNEHLSLFIEVARNAADKVNAGGSLIFMGGHRWSPPGDWPRNRIDAGRRTSRPYGQFGA